MINPLNPVFSKVDNSKQQQNNNISSSAQGSILERSPILDIFSPNSDISSENKKKILSILGVSVALTAVITATFKGKRSDSLINSLQSKVSTQDNVLAYNAQQLQEMQQKLLQSTTALEKQGKMAENVTLTLADREAKLTELKKLFEEFIEVPKNAENLIDKYTDDYLKMLENHKISYDAMKPILQKNAFSIPDYCKIKKLADYSPFKTETLFDDVIIPDKIKELFKSNGRLVLELPSTSKVKAVNSPDAYIGSKTLPNLGIVQETDMALDYGKRIDWTNQKIARDIMQNFYDGHGNTLDGVKLYLEKLPDGKTKVKIEGKGLFNYENLQYMGSGTKETNPYNAGGFGEGAKILVANLLGKKDTQSVIFRCADWQLEFDSDGKILQRTLNKVNQNLDGNYIEFSTENEKLVDAIIDSINYFQHSKNPDFAQLSYDSPSFAFRIKDNEKGNIYLTQRFEFDAKDNWDGSVDNLDIIFKRKPDPERYKEITGCDLPKDRDRTHLTFKDIENMTMYFAKEEMSTDDIIKAIVSTKPMWGIDGKIPVGSGDTAIKSFLKGLISVLNKKYIALDLGNERFACCDYKFNSTVEQTLRRYGFKILPDEFSKIKIPTTSQVFENLSVHKPINPTANEVKKIKILDEAVSAIADEFDQALISKLKSAHLELGQNKTLSKSCAQTIAERFFENDELAQKYKQYRPFDAFYDFKDMPQEELSELSAILVKKIEQELASLANCSDKKEISEFFNYLERTGIFDFLDVKSSSALRSMADYCLVTKKDAFKPKYVFDRKQEIASNVLGESITENGEYFGHWVDKEYLDTAEFNEILGTWIHEICHKAGGDGTGEFTYALTDLARVLLSINKNSSLAKTKLAALGKVYEKLSA